jgi:hypothetical protein
VRSPGGHAMHPGWTEAKCCKAKATAADGEGQPAIRTHQHSCHRTAALMGRTWISPQGIRIYCGTAAIRLSGRAGQAAFGLLLPAASLTALRPDTHLVYSVNTARSTWPSLAPTLSTTISPECSARSAAGKRPVCLHIGLAHTERGGQRLQGHHLALGAHTLEAGRGHGGSVAVFRRGG